MAKYAENVGDKVVTKHNPQGKQWTVTKLGPKVKGQPQDMEVVDDDGKTWKGWTSDMYLAGSVEPEKKGRGYSHSRNAKGSTNANRSINHPFWR